MSWVEVALAAAVGLIVNEFTDVSPWLARKLVTWSARQRYGATARAEIRSEELTAVINDRPGKLFKLGTGLRFASAAVVVRLRRAIGNDAEASDSGAEEVLPLARLLSEDEPSTLVARYLFPTERYRGEWKRHWIHPAKGMLIILLYGGLGAWAAVLRIDDRYLPWILATVVTTTVLLLAVRVGLWYFGRFVITNKRLMGTEGLVFRRVTMIPLLRVTDLRYVQSPLGRLLNYGTFRLESASRRNALRKIADLPHPNELYLRLVEEMYEPQAVEARRRPIERADGADEPGDVRQAVIDHIGVLATELHALTELIRDLTPAGETTSDNGRPDHKAAVESNTARANQPDHGPTPATPA